MKTQQSTRSSATAEIARDADADIQGHSRSSVVVPIDAAYMASYYHSVNSNINLCLQPFLRYHA